METDTAEYFFVGVDRSIVHASEEGGFRGHEFIYI